ncbi:demethyllactenocin mycarosyltransferase-like isoform X1 [Tetranychus urticae]|nr:demethyllactenocin mycarosyltransferase-like isoform X1 [Tetranychus urticae]
MGIGKLLAQKGHDVMFIHFPEHQELVERQGVKFISLWDYKGANEIPTEGFLHDSTMKDTFDSSKKYTPQDIMSNRGGRGGRGGRGRGGGGKGGMPSINGENDAIINAINSIKPDAVLGDYRWPMPFMTNCPVPFIPIMSNAPLQLYNGPPLGSGLSVFDSPEKWEEYRSSNKGFGPHGSSDGNPWGYAEYLGIYIYPEALDYKELGPPAKNWVRLDSSIRKPDSEDFEIPDKLKDKPGKLIYVSMGTNASNNPQLIKMLVDACALIPHRFIVATGKNGDSIPLPDNVWGDKFLKQVNILPKVDLVVTHCGSNSLIESLCFGKPMVTIPQFDDQLDNGQRVADLKLGKVISMWQFTEEKFASAIEEVLNSAEIHENVEKISKEMSQSSAPDKVVELIEYVARNRKSPFE